MNDTRNLNEITAQHPLPWSQATLPGIRGGMAQVAVFDATGREVPLFTLLRIVQLVTVQLHMKQQAQPQAAAP